MAPRHHRSYLYFTPAALGLLVAQQVVLLNGCGSARPNVVPSITFSRLPRSSDGGTDTQGLIEGHVDGAHVGEQIVLFARSGSGVWWVQPFADRPFTDIHSDQRWRNMTHLGTEYAAVLVDPAYRPPETTNQLPQKGGQSDRRGHRERRTVAALGVQDIAFQRI